jgi:prepilin-type N-terminal cleavage/methylation domain-containing protein
VKHTGHGFTLVEVLVAVVVLGIGITALVGSSAMVTRMIGRGQMETRAAQLASRRLETLRREAYSTSPRCTSGGFASGGPSTSQGVTESWQLTGTNPRTLTVTVSYKTARGTHSDVVSTLIRC